MKPNESDLQFAGIRQPQLDLIRQQHAHLRSSGKSADLTALAQRARFLNGDDVTGGLQSDHALPMDGASLEGIVPLDVCMRFACLPIEFSQGVLRLKSAQPLNTLQLQRIRDTAKVPVQRIERVPASRQDVLAAIQQTHQSGSVSGLIDLLRSEGLDAGRLRNLVFAVLREALRLRASDIHLSRKADPDAWIVYRIDSFMKPIYLLPELLMQSLVARIKIEAGMDASNSRTAQDGRLALEFDGRVVDFRISTQPLVDGESIVLRALDPSLLPGLPALFPNQPRMIELIRGITDQAGKSGGLVFVSGATGSGKSTTQYTMACGFRRDTLNVITVEDPVEYLLPFAKQIQLQALIRQKAIELERSILRQDPDILIFGEIRDADSARAALAFAESGHLVISTIHANSATQVIERFLSVIGTEHRSDAEFLLANYLRLVIHQKLLPRLCVCAVPCNLDEHAAWSIAAERSTGGLLKLRDGCKKAVGCERCLGSGYRGRVAAHETLSIPNQESMRTRFVRAFRDGRVELPVDLTLDNGIEFIGRLQTFETLLSHGVVDWPTVSKFLGGA